MRKNVSCSMLVASIIASLSGADLVQESSAASAAGSTEPAPYPPSPVIQSLRWDDAVFKVKTRAGDNWPITWVGGDLQITAWGDGPGFDEKPPRLSLGFARVWGDPPNLRAEDFTTDADTVEGGGSSATKASGLLLVDGTLYMWVRNYRPPGSDDFTNARLAWSKNGGTNWTWADWHFADTFGCPEFVQFGPNYAGARDDYVYVVSQANDSAYGYSPDIVMARVPRKLVPERARYEFFAGLDRNGAAQWSPDLSQRQPIFTDTRGTQRVAITYNSGLTRYLLTTSHRPAGSSATHTSALGVFDAPEPWGPWTTVYYDSHWSGTNRTYHHKFPTKWMSPDGRTLWLLYSGLDGGLYTFCLKKATLETRRTFHVDGAHAADAEMLSNGQMEAPFAGGLAQGWVPNCYGSNTVVFAQETNDLHGGKTAQRINCTDFDSGGVQFHSGDIAIEKGKPYTLRLWMKGDVKGPVYVGLRKHGEPYTPYLKRDVRVKGEWTPYLIIGQPSDSDLRCALYIMFTGTGTLLIDDVSLKPGTHEDAVLEMAGPVQKGNRVYNSGFEAGPEGWTPVEGFVLDEQVSHSGRFSARLEVSMSRGELAGIECRPFPVRTGRRYALSAWIRAAAPNTRVGLRLFEWADAGGDFLQNRHERQITITATTEWARYQLSGILLPNLHEGYVVRILPSGRIWLDDVQVEEGSQTEYRPAQPLEVGAETPTRWCRVGDTVEVTARAAAGSQRDPVDFKYTLEDLWSRPLTNLAHQVKPGEPDRASFQLRQPGIYRVRVRANESPATGEVWFGVFPQRDRKLRPESPFGTHVTSMVPEPGNTLLASAAMGARWVRLHDFGDYCHWYQVEPEKGRFAWHDRETDALRERGFLIFANLGHPPRWAGRDSEKSWWGTAAPPRDLSEWENYVFRTVEHYRERIRYWEVWNEPYWKGFFTGTPEEYAELLKVAYRTIKRADPQAVVVGGCFTPSDEAWTKRVLSAGGLEFMDALSYHVYWSPPVTESAATDEAPLVARQVQRYVELMREHGQPKPIYMSEGGIRCPPFASWLPADGFERSAPFGPYTGAGVALTGLDAAAGLVRGMVEMLSAGAEKVFYYYSGHEVGAMPWFSTMANGYYVLLDYDGRPKPTMMAYSALEFMLVDATPAGVMRRNGLTVHLFGRGNGAGAVAWSAHTRPLSLPPVVSVCDLMGNKMSSSTLNAWEPVYLLAPTLKPAQLQEILQ